MKKRKSKQWIIGVIALLASITLIAGACSDPEGPAADDPEPTAPPADEATEPPADTPAAETPAPATPEVSAIGETEALVASVLAGIHIVDSAGFHGIAHDLAGADEINPRMAGQVTNVLLVTEQAAWPDALHDEVHDMTATLEAFIAALEAEDLDAARAASEGVHDAQHDLSNAAYGWLANQPGGVHDDAMVAMPSTMAAIEIIDGAGFHGLAHDLAAADELSPRLAGTVGKVLTATQAATWPADLQGVAAGLADDLEALKTAAEHDDLDAAREAAEAVHDAQHDLSDAVHGWVATAGAGSHGSAVADFACLAAAIHKIDSAGFHGLAHDLAHATEVNPRLAGTLSKVLAHARVAPWPHDAEAEAEETVETLAAFVAAVEADDLDSIRTMAEAMHDAQHDLSDAMYAWMGGPGHGH